MRSSGRCTGIQRHLGVEAFHFILDIRLEYGNWNHVHEVTTHRGEKNEYTFTDNKQDTPTKLILRGI